MLEQSDEQIGESIIEEELPHYNRQMWLVDCNRIVAETHHLKGREKGTFLIRPKDKSEQSFVLSIV